MPEIILIDIVSSALYQFVDGQVLFVKVNITIYSYLEIRKSFQVFFHVFARHGLIVWWHIRF